ncbi:BLUF domain-containing protein [Sphingomonas sp. ID0503]|uniref:BLUF domain-containing protein n=1 Tax=Sphingomonas sp. ID0503 TaxID=3399691 RepID=UPI003AFB2CC5
MFQLTYISTAAYDLPADAVDGILATSRRNNAERGITGLLVHDGKRFLQALEGEQEEVETTFDRIVEDGRHRAVVILSRRQVEEREFGPWAMASDSAVAATDHDTIPELVDALTAEVPNATARERFRSFARVRHAA